MKFKIHRTYYTLVQSILPASTFCVAKTFLRHDGQCIKHNDNDLMNSGDITTLHLLMFIQGHSIHVMEFKEVPVVKKELVK